MTTRQKGSKIISAMLLLVILLFTVTAERVSATANFGITTSGTASYPTTTATVNTGASHATGFASAVYCVGFTATVTVAVTIVGVNIYSAAGNTITAIYDSTPSHVLGTSASTTAVNAWNDLALTATTHIVGGTGYWLCAQFSSSSANVYYSSSSSGRSAAQGYGSFPDPISTSTGANLLGLRYTYVTEYKGVAKATQVTLGVGGAIIQGIFFYTHVAGQWRGALYQNNGNITQTYGGTASNIASAYVWATKITISAIGNTTTLGLSWYDTTACSFRIGLYNDGGTRPSTLIGQSASTACQAGTGIQDVAITLVVPTVGSYWIAWQTSASNRKVNYGAAATSRYYTHTYANGLDANWSTSDTADSAGWQERIVYMSQAPGTKLLDCPSVATNGAGWSTIGVASCTPSSLTIAAISRLWLAYQWNNNTIGPSYCDGIGGDCAAGTSPYGNSIVMAYAAFPDPWTVTWTATAEYWAMYASYTTILTTTISILMTMSVGVSPGRTEGMTRTISQPVTVDPSVGRTVAVTRTVSFSITESESLTGSAFIIPPPGGAYGVDVPWLFAMILGGSLAFVLIMIVARRRREAA